MSTIDELRFKTSIDTSGWSSGIKAGTSAVDKFYGGLEGKSKALPAPKFEAPQAGAGAEGGVGQIQDFAATLLPLASQIQRAFGSALQPLTQFAARFSAQFDQVGGAVLALSERIDEHMRFPKFVQRVEKVRAVGRKVFGLIPKDAQKAMAKVEKIDPHLEPLSIDFERASSRIKASISKVPDFVHEATARAEQIKPNLGAYVAGFENAAKKARGAIVPPDDGKGYELEKSKRSKAASARARDASGRFGKGAASKLDLKPVFTPPPAREDQLPQRVGPTRPMVQGKWEVQSAPQAMPPAPAPKFATQEVSGSISKFQAMTTSIQVASSAFGTLGKAASVGIGVASTAVQGGARVADKAIGVYLGWEKLKSFWKTLGSVAEKSFSKINAIKIKPFKFDLSTTINQITKVGNVAGAASAPVVNFGKSLAVAFGAFGAAFKAAEFVKNGVTEASNLNETISATEAILGNASGAVKTFADQMAKDFGLIKRETLEAASGFGGLGKGIGNLKGEDLSAFSIKFTKLAADLSSFKNLDFSEATQALRTVLAGEQSDSLKKIGVIINETTTKQYALANGIAKVGQELNEEQKFLARAGQLTEKLKDASGDLEKTQAGAANQLRKLQGNITNVGASIGQALLPILTRGLTTLNGFLSDGGSIFDRVRPAVEGFASGVATAIDRIGQVIAAAMPTVIDFGKGLIASLGDAANWAYSALPSFGQFVSGAQSAFSTLYGAISGVVSFLRGIPTAIDGAFGEGSAMMILKLAGTFAVAVGAAMLIVPVITSIPALVGSMIASFAGVTPIIALIGTGVVSLLPKFLGLTGTIGGIAYIVRNLGDLTGIAFLQIGDKVEYVKQVFLSIPTILGQVASYVQDNWLAIITKAQQTLLQVFVVSVAKIASTLWEGFKGAVSLVGNVLWELPGVMVSVVGTILGAIGSLFSNLWTNLKNYGKAVKEFVQNPTGGIDWKLPELKLPKFQGSGDEIEKRLAAIDAKEKARLAEAPAKPFEFKPEVPLAPAVAPPKVDTTAAEYAGKAAEKTQKELESFAKSFKTKVRTPLEEYSEVLEKAGKAYEAGLLTAEEFQKADRFARKEANLDEHKVSGALELGSKEAYSSLVSALYGKGESDTSKIAQSTLMANREQVTQLKALNKKLGASVDPIPLVQVA